MSFESVVGGDEERSDGGDGGDELERSLKQQEKWEVKMNRKMMVFAKARVGFDFSKMIHFRFILKSFFKNEIKK